MLLSIALFPLLAPAFWHHHYPKVSAAWSAVVIVPCVLAYGARARRHRAHTLVFFIFLVANIGGALTPLGDPPLFLGFLHGVPFFWTFALWKEMLFTAGAVLGAYLCFDLYWWRREDALVRARPAGPGEPIRVEGWHNVFFLGGVLAAVILSGTVQL